MTFQKLANVMRVSFMTMKIRSSFQFLWQDIWFHIVKLEFMCGDEYEMLNWMIEAVLMDNGIIWFDRISHGNPWITSKTHRLTQLNEPDTLKSLEKRWCDFLGLYGKRWKVIREMEHRSKSNSYRETTQQQFVQFSSAIHHQNEMHDSKVL